MRRQSRAFAGAGSILDAQGAANGRRMQQALNRRILARGAARELEEAKNAAEVAEAMAEFNDALSRAKTLTKEANREAGKAGEKAPPGGDSGPHKAAMQRAGQQARNATNQALMANTLQAQKAIFQAIAGPGSRVSPGDKYIASAIDEVTRTLKKNHRGDMRNQTVIQETPPL